MKKIIFILSLVFACSLIGNAQTTEAAKNYIEVTGTSEMEIVPDEIYVTIVLMERMENKDKVGIEKQEADLKQNLKELGIDLSNLTLSKADADYRKVRRSSKDVLVSKSYILKLSNADMIGKVYERLDKIDAYDAHISKYSHSKILEYQKTNRINAIKVAKEKVDYLLSALEQQAGSPLLITENENWVQDQPLAIHGRMAYKNATVFEPGSDKGDSDSDISFKKIKIRNSFLVRYEILKK